MRNLWIQTESPFATWVADLEALRGRPEDLVQVVTRILGAGARTGVFVPVELPTLGFRRDATAATATEAATATIAELLTTRWREQRTVDLFAFTGAAMKPGAPGSSTVEATMAWYDASDALTEQPTSDLGEVLRALEPSPGAIPDGFTRAYPPVRITGPEVTYDGDGLRAIDAHARRALEIRVAIHSDIWFPFVFGSAHPEADHRRMFDNRELASRHTPRLNAFLAEVGTIVAGVGGRWRVEEEATGTNAILWLDEHGILVDAPAPELMPAAALQAEWY